MGEGERDVNKKLIAIIYNQSEDSNDGQTCPAHCHAHLVRVGDEQSALVREVVVEV